MSSEQDYSNESSDEKSVNSTEEFEESSEENSVEETKGSDEESSSEEEELSEGELAEEESSSEELSEEELSKKEKESDEESSEKEEAQSEELSEEELSEEELSEEEQNIYSGMSLEDLKHLAQKKRTEGINILTPDDATVETFIESLMVSDKDGKTFEETISNLKTFVIPELKKRDELFKKVKKSQKDTEQLHSLVEKYGDVVISDGKKYSNEYSKALEKLQETEAFHMIKIGEKEKVVSNLKKEIEDLKEKEKLLVKLEELESREKKSKGDKYLITKHKKTLQGMTKAKLEERIGELEERLVFAEKGEMWGPKQTLYKKPIQRPLKKPHKKPSKQSVEKAIKELEKIVPTKAPKKVFVVSQETSHLTERQMEIFDAIKRKMSQPLVATKEVVDIDSYIRERDERKQKIDALRTVYPTLTTGGYVPGEYIREREGGRSGVIPAKTAKGGRRLLNFEAFEQLKTYLEEFSEEVEIEASIGRYVDGKFRPGVTLFVFGLLKEHFDVNETFDHSKHSDIVRIVQKTRLRQIITGKKKEIQQKTRELQHIKSVHYGVKISKSKEGELDGSKNENTKFDSEWLEIARESDKSSASKIQLLVTRTRNRETYTNKILPYKVELTRVKEDILFEGGRVETYYKNEVEIELTNTLSSKDFLESIENTLSVGYMGVPFQDIPTKEEEEQAINYHNSFFENDRFKGRGRIIFGYWNEPRNIHIGDFFSGGFKDALVTIKLNGKRVTVFADLRNIYMCASDDIFKIGEHDGKLTGCVLDCEYMKESINGIPEFKVFDILVYEGKDIRKNFLKQRRPKIQKVIGEGVSLFAGKKMTIKEFNDGPNIYDRIRKTINDIDSDPKYKKKDLEDGILIQTDGDYRSAVWKWKPEEKMTIDFLFSKMNLEDKKLFKVKGNGYWLKVKDGKDLVPFIGSLFEPFSGWIVLKDGLFQGQDPEGRVLECKWDKKKNTFVPERYRDDKPMPNASSAHSRKFAKDGQRLYNKTADDVWGDIHRPISKKTIQGYDMKLMRKYHMETKRFILKKYFTRHDVLVEIGSGRGGMIKDWSDIDFEKVYAIEPDKDFMKIFNKRLIELENKEQAFENEKADKEGREPKNIPKKNYVPIETGAEDPDLKDMISDVTGMTAFFSLTFFPENKQKYVGLLNNISLLPKGGVFAGIVMEGTRTKNLLDHERVKQGVSEDESVTFVGSDIMPPTLETKTFSIEQLTLFDESKTGIAEELEEGSTTNRIKVEIYDEDTMVKTRDSVANVMEGEIDEIETKEYTEWLFFFDKFRTHLEKRGFRLLDEYFLDDDIKYDMLPTQSKVFSDLNRVFAFEKL